MAILIAGCDRDDSVATYKAPKEQSSKAPEEQSSRPVSWTLPAGWKEVANTGQMRFATIAVSSDDPSTQLTVVPLGPDMPLLQNINRWENQIGLPPSTDQQAKDKIKLHNVNGETIKTIELVGTSQDGAPAQAILAAFVERPDRTWYFKLQAAGAKVEPQKARFDAFVQSIRFAGDANATAAASPAESSAPSAKPADPAGELRWSAPQAWKPQHLGPMRLMSWIATTDRGEVEIVISRRPLDTFGNLRDNLNYWRGVVGAGPLQSDDLTPEPKPIAIGDTHADVYDLVGVGEQPLRMRVALLKSPDQTAMYFIRLQGSADAVERCRDDFDAFVHSMRFVK